MTNPKLWPRTLPPLNSFIEKVKSAGEAAWRDLPWRNIDDAYGVWVSEVMLQQTQVARVLNYWPKFMAAFPTVDALAAAEAAEVQRLCMGLGYYQRFRRLKLCADELSAHHAGLLPRPLRELRALPGIGEATAAGIVVFAYNEPAIYLETNVRTVFIHELFPDASAVTDAEIKPLIEASCPAEDPRRWYYALLDYGAQLKADLPNPSRASAHYHRQSRFEGSWRQKRAWLLRRVLEASAPLDTDGVYEELCAVERDAQRPIPGRDDFERLVKELSAEGLIASDEGRLFV